MIHHSIAYPILLVRKSIATFFIILQKSEIAIGYRIFFFIYSSYTAVRDAKQHPSNHIEP